MKFLQKIEIENAGGFRPSPDRQVLLESLSMPAFTHAGKPFPESFPFPEFSKLVFLLFNKNHYSSEALFK